MAAIAVAENTRVFLLDIEGTTTPITFVKVRAHSPRSWATPCPEALFCCLLSAGHLIPLHQRESGGISVCTLGRGRVQTRCASAQETGFSAYFHMKIEWVVVSTVFFAW